MLIPLFEMLYERGKSELWYYDEHGNYVASHCNRRGIRQGCVLGAFLFCLAMRSVYTRLGELLGQSNALYAYSDDVYLISNLVDTVKALSTALGIYMKVDIRSGWGPCKTELILPPDCDPEDFLSLMDILGEGLPHIVPGVSACLGVARHATNDPKFIAASLENLGIRHDIVIDLVILWQMRTLSKSFAFSKSAAFNILTTSSVPPPLILDFHL